MRRFLSALLVVAALALVPVAPASAAFEPLGEEIQVVNGSIALPTRFTDGESGFPGLGRRLYLQNPATNGTFMYVFPVDPATWGGAFVIDTVTDATATGDMDIYLYEDLGTAEYPGATNVITLAEYDTGGPGEVGFIPAGTRYGIVFTANAVRASFTYHGFSPATIGLGVESLDLTIPAGATVVWENRTQDYAYVRHTPSKGKVLFDSSPKPGTGIGQGKTFSFVFNQPGVYPYVTSAGVGTITVTEGPGAGTPSA